MELTNIVPSSKFYFPNPPHRPNKTQFPSSSSSSSISQISKPTKSPNPTNPRTHQNPLNKSIKNNPQIEANNTQPTTIKAPTMSDIMESSKSQNIDLRLQTIGPFFRITAKSLETKAELGRAEGLIRVWWKGKGKGKGKGKKILHLDSIRMRRESTGMERSIFGIGLFIGAVAIRYGYDCGCSTAELLAINDSPLYHSKLVRFYTRIGFKAVHEVTGSTIGDMGHMLIWGGVGTRMDADVKDLLLKWCTRFTPSI